MQLRIALPSCWTIIQGEPYSTARIQADQILEMKTKIVTFLCLPNAVFQSLLMRFLMPFMEITL